MKLYSILVALILAMAIISTDASAADMRFNDKEAQLCERYFSKYEKEYTLPARLLKAISTQESGRWNSKYQKKMPWPWTINAEGKGYYFATKRQAIAKVRKLQRQGVKSIDVGCMQINLRYHPEAFQSLNQAFDPATNIAYSAELLRKHYENKESWKKAVASYHSGAGASHSERGRDYAKKVLTVWREEIDNMIARSKNRLVSRFENPVAKPKVEDRPVAVSSLQEQVELVRLDIDRRAGLAYD